MFRRLRALFSRKTFRQLTVAYLASPAYLSLSPASQTPYRLVITRLAEHFGPRPLAGITRADIEAWIATRTPGAANDDLKKLRILFRFALGHGWLTADPTAGIRRFPAGDGHHSWTEAEIARYEAHWPLGSRERLAFALLLYTGQRRADVARMRWGDLEGDRLTVRQRKTGTRLVLPLHPQLRAALPDLRSGLTILRTKRGQPFSVAGFGLWMARKIGEAGLPERCVTHGLRKAAARRLAEAGCSAHEIAAITGHRTLSEVQRYADAARQERLAQQALARLG